MTLKTILMGVTMAVATLMLVPTSAFAGTWGTDPVTIQSIADHGVTTGFVINVPGHTYGNCTYGDYFRLSPSDSAYKEKSALLLGAFLSDKKVQLQGTDGNCLWGYPVIEVLYIVNE